MKYTFIKKEGNATFWKDENGKVIKRTKRNFDSDKLSTDTFNYIMEAINKEFDAKELEAEDIVGKREKRRTVVHLLPNGEKIEYEI